MKTEIYQPTDENLAYCASLIAKGEIVAFPTETVYGLGANALCPESVKKIYAAKGRPSDNPLIVHIASSGQIDFLAASVPEKAKRVVERFMPGPVTIVLPKKEIVPDEVTGGLKTVAIRMPSSEIASKLIELSGCPICAPSANTSTRPSPTIAKHVYDDLNGKIAAIIDGGECEVGVESTVIDFCAEGKVRLLRAGGMPIELLESEIGEIEVVKNSKVALCPGMKYKHYAPNAEVYLAPVGESEKIIAAYDRFTNNGKKAVIVALDGNREKYGTRTVWSAGKDSRDYAHNLFSLLRRSDDEKADVVLCESVTDDGYGLGVENRLGKASGGKTL